MSNFFYTKKLLKKQLIQKKLIKLKNFIIFLPNPIIKKNVFRINQSAFLKLNEKIFNFKTIPANALITNLAFYKQNNDNKNLQPIIFFFNNTYLLTTQSYILDNLLNYTKLTKMLSSYIKMIKIFKVYSVKKN